MNVLLVLFAWLQALRLQFYPMTLIAYAVGALAAAQQTQAFDSGRFWLGYAALFFLEVATVLANDFFDYESDRQNPNAGPFLPATPACWWTASSDLARSAEESSWPSVYSRCCCAPCSRRHPTLRRWVSACWS
jgi:4-hydroxybenzoate polyprenyltransferase